MAEQVHKTGTCSFRKCVSKASIVRIDIVTGYKGCSCQSVRIERRYDGCKVYATKQKSLAGVVSNFVQVCDHSAMNKLNGVASLYLCIRSCMLSVLHFQSSPYTNNVTTMVKVFGLRLRHRKGLRVSNSAQR